MSNKSGKRRKVTYFQSVCSRTFPEGYGFCDNDSIKQLFTKKNDKPMLIIPVKEGEAIERALKRFKRKFDKTGTMKQLRARQQFNKPSVVKRQQKVKAIYVQSLRNKEEE